MRAAGKLVEAETYLCSGPWKRSNPRWPKGTTTWPRWRCVAIVSTEAVARWRAHRKCSSPSMPKPTTISSVLDHLQQLDDALVPSAAAIELKPDFAEARQNPARSCRSSSDLPRRPPLFVRPAEARSVRFAARTRRGPHGLGEYVEALPHHQRAIELRPAHAESHGALGGTLLSLGKLVEGWPQYEWRWKLPGMEERHRQCPACWNGRAARDGRIFFFFCSIASSRMATRLQFIRYAALGETARERAGDRRVSCVARAGCWPDLRESTTVVVAGSLPAPFRRTDPLAELAGRLADHARNDSGDDSLSAASGGSSSTLAKGIWLSAIAE